MMSHSRPPRALRTPLDQPIRAFARHFGERAVEMERFVKFLFVGTIGFCIDFGLFNILQASILPPVDANSAALRLNVALAVSISFLAGVLSNFTWNRYWTYPDSRTRALRTQLMQFAFINCVGWAVRTAWVTIAYQTFGDWLHPLLGNLSLYAGLSIEDASARIGTNVTLIIGILVVLLWNFFANRYWTYADVDSRVGYDVDHHN